MSSQAIFSAEPTKLRLILTTFSSEEEAEQVISTLLAEQLIACGSLIPGVKSFYHWEGKKEVASEVISLFKTAMPFLEKMLARLQELHPYEVPELIVLPPQEVSASYEKWVLHSLANHHKTL